MGDGRGGEEYSAHPSNVNEMKIDGLLALYLLLKVENFEQKLKSIALASALHGLEVRSSRLEADFS